MRNDLDRVVDAMASKQWGVWTGDQSKRLGVSRSLTSERVLKRLWQRLYPNVYAHSSWVHPPEGEALAAAWSLPDGVAGFDSAAWLHAVEGSRRRGEPHIVVPRGNQRARPFSIHTTSFLPSWAVTHVRGVPCTTVARTLVDLTTTWDPDRLEDAWSAALLSKLTTISRIEAAALPLVGRGWGGTELASRLIKKHDGGDPPPESTLERLLYQLVEGGGYGELIRQMPLPSFQGLRQRADGFLPAVALFVEADGRRWHTKVRDLERDHRRDNEAQALGYHVARFDYLELVEHPERCIEVLDTHFRRCGYERTRSGVWIPADSPPQPVGIRRLLPKSS